MTNRPTIMVKWYTRFPNGRYYRDDGITPDPIEVDYEDCQIAVRSAEGEWLEMETPEQRLERNLKELGV